ncbi:Mce protein [Mycobacterium vicinigordonae]|uniref:Mce protein n=1 Tax=Mycobacterium vicinigordonae TaxID=1719132 RepID=A0A7D6HWV6_9MYCO|nr:Mce protein [Mycobacterium vicinigordonae]QLL06495.1 Mce protein [Mycobacterium vicinigordonae]
MAGSRESADDGSVDDGSVDKASTGAEVTALDAPTTASADGDVPNPNDESVGSRIDDEPEEDSAKSADTGCDKAKGAPWWRRNARSASNHEGADGSRLRRRVRSVIRSAAVAVLVAVVAGAGYEGWLLFRQHETDVAARQALETAERYAVILTSADAGSVDKNIADVLSGATGEFKQRYAKAGAQLRKMLVDNKVAAQGSVVASAVKTASKNKVEVLLVVRQSLTNEAHPDPRADITAVTMTMEKTGDRWLVSGVALPEDER